MEQSSSKTSRSRLGKMLSALVRSMANTRSDVEVTISINFHNDKIGKNSEESKVRVIKKKRELGRISDMDPSLKSWGNRHFPSNRNNQRRDGPYERVGDLRSSQQSQHNCDDSSTRQRRKNSPEKLSLGGLVNGGLSSTGISDEDTFPKTEELFPAANITYSKGTH